MSKILRELETRETEKKPVATWAPPELLPQPNERPGWVHRYVRTSTLGTMDPMNISSKRREWRPQCMRMRRCWAMILGPVVINYRLVN